MYILGHIGNLNQTPVYSDMLLNATMEEKGVKTFLIRGLGSDKTRIAIMLNVLANGHKLPQYVILLRKTMLKETLPAGLVI
jgi:hypothetical protein